MLRRPQYIALIMVVLFTVTIMNLPRPANARIKLAIGSLFLPLFGLKASARELTHRAADATMTKAELLKENEALREEIQQLHLQGIQTEQMSRENARLRQLVGWQQQKPWKLKLGRVVLREPSNWWRAVQIDLGSRDGIRPEMPVLTVDGLIGKVSSVNVSSSQVVLLGDPSCRVAARVENDTGVIGASGPLESEFVELGFLSKNANLKPGQPVKTSGEGGIFPKDIPIGKVVDVRAVEYGLANVARVKLSANLSALEEVWVIAQ
jgi:rod shape-determining protein MreC